jgi:hypothetical protein
VIAPVLTVPSRDERIGSARQSVLESVKADADRVKTFNEMTPEQQAAGKLIGKILETGTGNAAVDAAFSWWEIEHNNGEKLDWIKKQIALLEVLATQCMGSGEEGYRNLRKIVVTLNQR